MKAIVFILSNISPIQTCKARMHDIPEKIFFLAGSALKQSIKNGHLKKHTIYHAKLNITEIPKDRFKILFDSSNR